MVYSAGFDGADHVAAEQAEQRGAKFRSARDESHEISADYIRRPIRDDAGRTRVILDGFEYRRSLSDMADEAEREVKIPERGFFIILGFEIVSTIIGIEAHALQVL